LSRLSYSFDTKCTFLYLISVSQDYKVILEYI